jgi:hypothetical protein
MPNQPDQSGASEEVRHMQARIDELEKRNKELEEELAGKIPQVSSAALHNYPDAEYEKAEPPDEQPKPQQPLTGAAATAQEH